MSDHSRRHAAAHWDHERDLRKCEPRPTDPPHDAIEIAVLAQAVSIHSAAQLIEQYARTKAAEGRLQGVVDTFNLVDQALGTSGASDARP